MICFAIGGLLLYSYVAYYEYVNLNSNIYFQTSGLEEDYGKIYKFEDENQFVILLNATRDFNVPLVYNSIKENPNLFCRSSTLHSEGSVWLDKRNNNLVVCGGGNLHFTQVNYPESNDISSIILSNCQVNDRIGKSSGGSLHSNLTLSDSLVLKADITIFTAKFSSYSLLDDISAEIMEYSVEKAQYAGSYALSCSQLRLLSASNIYALMLSNGFDYSTSSLLHYYRRCGLSNTMVVTRAFYPLTSIDYHLTSTHMVFPNELGDDDDIAVNSSVCERVTSDKPLEIPTCTVVRTYNTVQNDSIKLNEICVEDFISNMLQRSRRLLFLSGIGLSNNATGVGQYNSLVELFVFLKSLENVLGSVDTGDDMVVNIEITTVINQLRDLNTENLHINTSRKQQTMLFSTDDGALSKKSPAQDSRVSSLLEPYRPRSVARDSSMSVSTAGSDIFILVFVDRSDMPLAAEILQFLRENCQFKCAIFTRYSLIPLDFSSSTNLNSSFTMLHMDVSDDVLSSVLLYTEDWIERVSSQLDLICVLIGIESLLSLEQPGLLPESLYMQYQSNLGPSRSGLGSHAHLYGIVPPTVFGQSGRYDISTPIVFGVKDNPIVRGFELSGNSKFRSFAKWNEDSLISKTIMEKMELFYNYTRSSLGSSKVACAQLREYLNNTKAKVVNELFTQWRNKGQGGLSPFAVEKIFGKIEPYVCSLNINAFVGTALAVGQLLARAKERYSNGHMSVVDAVKSVSIHGLLEGQASYDNEPRFFKFGYNQSGSSLVFEALRSHVVGCEEQLNASFLMGSLAQFVVDPSWKSCNFHVELTNFSSDLLPLSSVADPPVIPELFNEAQVLDDGIMSVTVNQRGIAVICELIMNAIQRNDWKLSVLLSVQLLHNLTSHSHANIDSINKFVPDALHAMFKVARIAVLGSGRVAWKELRSLLRALLNELHYQAGLSSPVFKSPSHTMMIARELAISARDQQAALGVSIQSLIVALSAMLVEIGNYRAAASLFGMSITSPSYVQVQHERSLWYQQRNVLSKCRGCQHSHSYHTHYVTVASNDNANLQSLRLSALISGVDLEVIGLGKQYQHFGNKAEWLHDYIVTSVARHTMDVNDILVFMDAYDVLIFPSIRTIAQQMKYAKSPIMFCSEHGVYPEAASVWYYKYGSPLHNLGNYSMSLGDHVKHGVLGAKKLNSGCFSGRVGHVLGMLQHVVRYTQYSRDDQQVYIRYALNHPHIVGIDTGVSGFVEDPESWGVPIGAGGLFRTAFKSFYDKSSLVMLVDFSLFQLQTPSPKSKFWLQEIEMSVEMWIVSIFQQNNNDFMLNYDNSLRPINLLHCQNKGSNSFYDSISNYQAAIYSTYYNGVFGEDLMKISQSLHDFQLSTSLSMLYLSSQYQSVQCSAANKVFGLLSGYEYVVLCYLRYKIEIMLSVAGKLKLFTDLDIPMCFDNATVTKGICMTRSNTSKIEFYYSESKQVVERDSLVNLREFITVNRMLIIAYETVTL